MPEMNSVSERIPEETTHLNGANFQAEVEDIKDLTTWGSNWMKLSSWNLEVAVVASSLLNVAAIDCDALEDEGGMGKGFDGVGYLVERRDLAE